MLAGVLAARFWVIAVDSRLGRGPTGAGFGADFGMFEAAAKALTLGRNPYDHRTLYATEWALMHAQRLLITGHVGLVRVGNPPLFFWALQPLTHLSFQPVAVVWILAMWVLAGAGFFALLRYFGWRRKLLPCALFLATPQVLTGVVVGNVVPVVFAAVAGALCLVGEYPFVAGLSLAAIWLKPQIGLPAVLLIVAFHCDRPRRVLGGFAGGSAALLGLIVVTTGWQSIADWVHGVQGYTESISSQVYVTSLASVYYQWASPALRELLSALALCLAAALTLAYWRRWRGARPPFADVAWLWFVWFLATPYAHIDDEMFLAIPLVALLGRDGVRIAEPVPAFATFLILFSAVRDPSWLPWELLIGAILLILPELRGQPAVPVRWKLGLFGVLFLSVVPNWGSYRVDAESLELLGAGLGAALLAINGRSWIAVRNGPQTSSVGEAVYRGSYEFRETAEIRPPGMPAIERVSCAVQGAPPRRRHLEGTREDDCPYELGQ